MKIEDVISIVESIEGVTGCDMSWLKSKLLCNKEIGFEHVDTGNIFVGKRYDDGGLILGYLYRKNLLLDINFHFTWSVNCVEEPTKDDIEFVCKWISSLGKFESFQPILKVNNMY